MPRLKSFRYAYPLPAVTADMVVFSIFDDALTVLLIQRKRNPHRGRWAIPGGFVEVGRGYAAGRNHQGESLETSARRELLEETGIELPTALGAVRQLQTFGDPGRDPRGRVISIAHYALIPEALARQARAGDDAARARWHDISTPREHGLQLAFDHTQILQAALDRVRTSIDEDPGIAAGLFPQDFSQKELRRAHELLTGEPYDRSNFARRFRRHLAEGRFADTGATRERARVGKPPKLYRFA